MLSHLTNLHKLMHQSMTKLQFKLYHLVVYVNHYSMGKMFIFLRGCERLHKTCKYSYSDNKNFYLIFLHYFKNALKVSILRRFSKHDNKVKVIFLQGLIKTMMYLIGKMMFLSVALKQ